MSRVLSVGQCGYDQFGISRNLKKGFGAVVAGAATSAEALSKIRSEPFDLVLVNRVLDADGTEGLDLIKAIKGDPALAGCSVMLVSNYPEAQKAAEALGALPGFGKAGLGTTPVTAKLAEVLKAKDPASSQ